MTIATDPKDVSLVDSDDDFEKHFNEFASGQKPDPHPEEQPEDAASEGNGTGDKPPAPDEGEGDPPKDGQKPEPATGEGEEPANATSDEAKPDGGDKPPEGAEAPDPWASVPDELKAERDRLQKERDEARHKAQSDANRVAALSRKLQQLTAAPTASAPEAPADEPSEAQKALDAKISQLRKDYGEIADPLIELIEAQKKELTTVRTVLTGLSEQRQAEVIAHETQALETKHPDWRDIARSEDFRDWLEVQPQNIQRLATSWDARETSVVLTLFKAEKVETTGQTAEAPPAAVETKPTADAATGARRSQQLDGGRDVRSRPAPAASGPPEDFDAAFAYYAEKRRLAQQRK
jgi:hypothetical protein